jgi:hypothetical protein
MKINQYTRSKPKRIGGMKADPNNPQVFQCCDGMVWPSLHWHERGIAYVKWHCVKCGLGAFHLLGLIDNTKAKVRRAKRRRKDEHTRRSIPVSEVSSELPVDEAE